MFQEFEVIAISQQIKKLMEQECGKLMKASGLRKVELDILYYISHAGERDTARDIISERHISKAHISKSVDNLRQRGYITLKEDAEDHRCMHIQITPLGLPIIDEFERIRRSVMAKLFAGVTEPEWECMRKVLDKLMVNVNLEHHRCN